MWRAVEVGGGGWGEGLRDGSVVREGADFNGADGQSLRISGSRSSM